MRRTMIAMASAVALAGLVGGAFAEEAKSLPMVAGEVTKVDTDQGKLSIKHEAIPNLGMDPMTMVFKAADPAMLKDLKAGDKIEFTADKVNGQISVLSVEKAK